ncbi:hypothetical protein [Deinococcus aquiradiocola]|uniref:Uncharacterized protein n=1 Tax=Deinococcus aquiradiocola TaxID=393059 RepID=A0A917PCX2_9DEIO|nr:hypothetical protein [Deinococcus aquiradiocola]GGJ71305.1 hypothetical protein GCM10008939_14600 [Deinococcus aquiradiocola]
MIVELAQRIAGRAYELDPGGLQKTMTRLGLEGWPEAIQHLQFQEIGTGGGCSLLSAFLQDPEEHQVIITDGEAGIPSSPDRFWLAIVDAEDTEIFSVSTLSPS